MALPAGISTCTVTVGSAFSPFGSNAAITVDVKAVLGGNASQLVWAATGQPIVAFTETFNADAGAVATFVVPHVNQDGFIDGSNSVAKNWSYYATITYSSATGQTVQVQKAFQPKVGQTTMDLDLVPDGSVTSPTSSPTQPVTSVNGQTGAVTLTKADVGLPNVDNTSDAAKPVSTATQAALDAKQSTSAKGQPNGYAALDGSGRLPAAQLPTAVPTTDQLAATYVPMGPTAPNPAQVTVWLDTSASPPALRYWTGVSWAPIYTMTSQGQASSYFNVVDNGDGSLTYTAFGSSVVTDNGDGSLTFTGSGVVDNGDGSLTFS